MTNQDIIKKLSSDYSDPYMREDAFDEEEDILCEYDNE